jgi:SAM-dependent methyltransferase
MLELLSSFVKDPSRAKMGSLVVSRRRAFVDHLQRQESRTDRLFAEGPRPFVVSPDPLTEYLISWRLREAMRRVMKAANGRLSRACRVLVLCAADGYEGSLLRDLEFEDVTVSDISPVAVSVALTRDPRLKGITLNAEDTGLDDSSFDLVITQDALHHLQRPVQGFTEMLRISRYGVIFLEPHDSLIGRMVGTKWEVHDEAKNYVFRWRKKLVGDLAASYLGSQSFRNLSFSFWHHNIVFGKLRKSFGGGPTAVYTIRGIKTVLDVALPGLGNQFCGLVLKD